MLALLDLLDEVRQSIWKHYEAELILFIQETAVQKQQMLITQEEQPSFDLFDDEIPF